jgi:hypothetical protein
MIPSREFPGAQADHAEEELDPRLAADLRIAYSPPPALHAVDAAISHAIAERETHPRASVPRPLMRRLRVRLTAPIAALALLAAGAGAYLHNQGPTPVSAQTILRRVETAGLVPNQITHFAYQITGSTEYSGTSEFWVRANAGGMPVGISFGSANPQSVPQSIGTARLLIAGYEAEANGSLPPSLAGSQVTGQQTFDGHAVDVVKLSNGVTLYVDASSYIVRGADWSATKNGRTDTMQVRLLQEGTVPLNSVPAGTWHLHGAAGSSSASGKP